MPHSPIPSPIEFQAGVALLGKLDLIEFGLTSAISGDTGSPLVSSPATRREMACVMTAVAAALTALAVRIDPLAPDPARTYAPVSLADITEH
jgi:hypothetical protein